MLTDDIFDLTEKIVAALGLPVTREQIGRAKQTTERTAVKLDPPVWVDINYDTQVVEGGVLHLYPDVYGRGTNTVEGLRTELQGGGVDVSRLDEQALGQMLGRASMREEFFVSVAEIKAGRAITAGLNRPLTDYSIEKKPAADESRGARAAVRVAVADGVLTRVGVDPTRDRRRHLPVRSHAQTEFTAAQL